MNSAIAPHFRAKVRDTEFYNQITDSPLRESGHSDFLPNRRFGESGTDKIRESKK